MTPVQDIPSNGNDLVDSLDRLKVDDGEPKLGRVATMEKINHNGLANGKTMGYSVRRGLSSLQTTVLGEWMKDEEGQPMLTTILGDSGLTAQPVLTTILGDGGFTGMFPVSITFAGLFANSSEVICTEVCCAVTADPCEGVQVSDEDFWSDIHMALREICIPLLFRKVRIYRAEYRAIQPLKAMLLNDRTQRSMITYGVRARTSTLSHRAVARRRS
ncbi:hypothetical protein CGCF415_v006855 [Colletotrichum fructicola]|nr:hypothetical protein CGCFRS4_v005783 [Colletotrichum fructicola]KAF4908210.1 hypothetical protein CGCF415_v006855 [Colletotrichum fructicola]KAF4939595.1 hypothetical protein CGCF245_v003446 [Colletotrichum fructicola]